MVAGAPLLSTGIGQALADNKRSGETRPSRKSYGSIEDDDLFRDPTPGERAAHMLSGFIICVVGCCLAFIIYWAAADENPFIHPNWILNGICIGLTVIYTGAFYFAKTPKTTKI